MTKILHVEIERCGDCPHYDNHKGDDYQMRHYCTAYGIEDIDNPNVIPDFCPLPTKPLQQSNPADQKPLPSITVAEDEKIATEYNIKA